MYGTVLDSPSSTARLHTRNNNNNNDGRLGGIDIFNNSLTLPNPHAATPAAAGNTTTTTTEQQFSGETGTNEQPKNNWLSDAAGPAPQRLGISRPNRQKPQQQPNVLRVSEKNAVVGVDNTIVVPTQEGLRERLQNVATSLRDRWRALRKLLSQEKQAKKNARQLPLKKRLKRAAMQQYRRMFKPTEIVFYVGQRSNPVHPFKVDDNKISYTYATRDSFYIYAGVVGVLFGLLWIYLLMSSNPYGRGDTPDTATLQYFLPAATVLASVWLITGQLFTHRIVIDTNDLIVRHYCNGMQQCVARYETSFIRLRRALTSADAFEFNLVFGARNFPEIFLSNKTKNAHVMRALGRLLAKTLHVNYFDFSDMSIYHVPRVPHFAADVDWTRDMLCMTYALKQRQAELDQKDREARRSQRNSSSAVLPLSALEAANATQQVSNINTFGIAQSATAIEGSSSVCLNVHALHQPQQFDNVVAINSDVISASALSEDEKRQTHVKHRPQMLSQPRHTAADIKRPTTLSHPLLPIDALSRPHVDDSLVSLNRMVSPVSTTVIGHGSSDNAEVNSPGIHAASTSIGSKKSSYTIIDETKSHR